MHTQFRITLWSIIGLFLLSYVAPLLAKILMVPAILYLLLLLYGLELTERKKSSKS
jgi:hypothetical protein